MSSFLRRVALRAPAYLAWHAAGIDISEGSVKCMQFNRHGGGLTVGSYSQIPLASGTMVNGEIEREDIIVEVLRTLRLKERVRFAVATLSERKAYLYQTIIAPEQKNIDRAVEFDLEAHVPLPPADTLFDYEIVRRGPEGTTVAVTAFARRIVEMYEKVFAAAGITLRALEIETQALARAVLSDKDRERIVMIVDMGKRATRLAVADHGVVSYTATVDFGGDVVTAALMKRFSIDTQAAEEMKNARGFLLGPENQDVVEAVASSISVLRDELARHVSFWNSPDPHDVPRTLLDRVVIAGGNANMLGLSEYLSGALSLPVVVADVWQNIFSLDEYIPAMPMNSSLEYAPAIGLAKKYALNTPW